MFEDLLNSWRCTNEPNAVGCEKDREFIKIFTGLIWKTGIQPTHSDFDEHWQNRTMKQYSKWHLSNRQDARCRYCFLSVLFYPLLTYDFISQMFLIFIYQHNSCQVAMEIVQTDSYPFPYFKNRKSFIPSVLTCQIYKTVLVHPLFIYQELRSPFSDITYLPLKILGIYKIFGCTL